MFLKESKYNVITEYKNGYIIFNSLTGAIGKLSKDEYSDFLSGSLPNDKINLLHSKGILIDPDYDEDKKINDDRFEGIQNESRAYLRIWPTSRCNAHCYYCFEKGLSGKDMQLETARQIVRYLEDFVDDGMNVDIQWFGGEPLLKIDVIDEIIKGLKKLCECKHSKYGGVMITNGSLITPEIANKMKNEWGIYRTQVTLDGFDKYYDNVKNYDSPSEHNFDRVLDNIEILAKTKMHVTIRMNYDTHNFSSLKTLIECLHGRLSKYNNISYYVYPVWSSFDQTISSAFVSKTKADEQIVELFDKLVDLNMCTATGIARLGYRPVQCDSCNKKSFSVLPNGDISKCCEAYNQIIGNIWDGIVDQDTFNYWISAELDEQCKDCKYLPICQGGCKASHFNLMPQCFAYKPAFEDILRWYVSRIEMNSCLKKNTI